MKLSRSIAGRDRKRVVAAMFIVIALVIAILHAFGVLERLDDSALDATQRLVRGLSPRAAIENVIIVGLDEGTERSFPEPFALWHRHLGELLTAIASGGPRLIALDIVLPERSYDELLPGLSIELVRGLIAAKRAGRLAMGVRIDSLGRPQPIDGILLAAAGQDTLGFAHVVIDRDGTARRLQSSPSGTRAGIPLLAERAALSLGLTLRNGIIDYACGKPFAYVPMQDVVAWAHNSPERLAAFADKAVFVGKVGPDDDPVRQPLSLAGWAQSSRAAPPGVVLLAQTVRALESDRILSTLPVPAQIALVLLCAAVVLVGGVLRTWFAAAALTVLLIGGIYAVYLSGMFVPPAGPLIAIGLGAITRSGYEAFEQRRFRLAIEQQFAGYVNQSLLEAILAGEVDPGRPRKYAHLAFLFADLRGFTTMTEALPAEQVLALLNRYYEAVIPAVHAYDGTIDNFRGDGILVIFGAPREAADAARSAVLAAREMFVQLEGLNAELAREGHPGLRMGIGLGAGDAVAGNIGTRSRHGYSAVGDAVNVAARLQSWCKPLGMRLIASEAIWRKCPDELPFIALGMLELAGHAPVAAYGVPEREFVTTQIGEKHLGESGSHA
jgi:adenylate cyclase